MTVLEGKKVQVTYPNVPTWLCSRYFISPITKDIEFSAPYDYFIHRCRGRWHNLRILKNDGLPANEETLPGVADKAHRSLRKSTARRDRKPEVIWKSGTGEVTVIVSEQ